MIRGFQPDVRRIDAAGHGVASVLQSLIDNLCIVHVVSHLLF